MKEKSKLIDNIKHFKYLKENLNTTSITVMRSGMNNYEIEHFDTSEILQEYIDTISSIASFEIKDEFTYFLYCLGVGILTTYFSNQYDDQYYKIMHREMNRYTKTFSRIRRIDINDMEEKLVSALSFILSSELSSDEIITLLKLEF